MHVHDFFIKGCKFYCYNNVMFDSSWELAYYIWLKDNNINFEYKGFVSQSELDTILSNADICISTLRTDRTFSQYSNNALSK